MWYKHRQDTVPYLDHVLTGISLIFTLKASSLQSLCFTIKETFVVNSVRVFSDDRLLKECVDEGVAQDFSWGCVFLWCSTLFDWMLTMVQLKKDTFWSNIYLQMKTPDPSVHLDSNCDRSTDIGKLSLDSCQDNYRSSWSLDNFLLWEGNNFYLSFFFFLVNYWIENLSF